MNKERLGEHFLEKDHRNRRDLMERIANYAFLNDLQLQKLKKLDINSKESLDVIVDWNDEADPLVDMDKIWDVLHFVLTGRNWSEALKENPLSESIFGEEIIMDGEAYIAYTDKRKIKAIATAMEQFDIREVVEYFRPEACQKAHLYPDVWDEIDINVNEFREEIIDYFFMLKSFYKRVECAHGNVMVTIY